MSGKKRGIMLKSLTLEDEGMQELINPVPLALALDDISELEAGLDVELEIENSTDHELSAIQDVIEMLEDTAVLLDPVSED